MHVPLPLAAGEWLEVLLPFLFLLFWVVSQIRNLFRAGDQGRAKGPVAVRPAPRQPADDAHRELARQVEEFLRRSSGEAAEGQARRPAAQPRPRGDRAAPPKPVAPPAGQGQRRQGGQRLAPTALPPAAQGEQALGSLGGHGSDVARHVGDAFAHELRHLEPGAVRPEAEPSVATPAGAASGLAALVRDPVMLRRLVIVREVLERPVDRW